MVLLFFPQILKVEQFPGQMGPSSHALAVIQGGSGRGDGVGWRWDVCPGSAAAGKGGHEDMSVCAWGHL